MATRIAAGLVALFIALGAVISSSFAAPHGDPAAPPEPTAVAATPVVPERDTGAGKGVDSSLHQPNGGKAPAGAIAPSAITNALLLSRTQYIYRLGYACVFHPSITPYSWAWASVTEVNSAGTPFIGAATIRVNNVVPRYGSACARVGVDWGSTLRVRVDFLVHPKIG